MTQDTHFRELSFFWFFLFAALSLLAACQFRRRTKTTMHRSHMECRKWLTSLKKHFRKELCILCSCCRHLSLYILFLPKTDWVRVMWSSDNKAFSLVCCSSKRPKKRPNPMPLHRELEASHFTLLKRLSPRFSQGTRVWL